MIVRESTVRPDAAPIAPSGARTVDAATRRTLLEHLQRVLEQALARGRRRAATGADAVLERPVRLLDERAFRSWSSTGPPDGLGPGSVDARVVVLADAPTPSRRLHLLASGALAVFDASEPAADLSRRLRGIVERIARGRREPTLQDLGTRSGVMAAVLDQARRSAAACVSLLLTGETGVGKEHLARAVHASGPRWQRPFVTLNCGALPENLLESQLFGHERGAFTGADRQQKGFFEMADGGTLLLDEIGEMPLHLQVKLLNVLESHEVLRLGAQRPVGVDVRVMAATNRDIEADVASGRFRADLFYRINVIHLRVPPLRRRAADIPELVGRFLFDFRSDLGSAAFATVDDAALQALLGHAWPGNVRELRNVLERCLVLNRSGRISADDLPREVREPSAAVDGPAPAVVLGVDDGQWDRLSLRQVRDAAVRAAERAYITRLLRQTRGRVGLTATRAGIRPRSLYDKMRAHGLRKEEFRCAP
ncbi:MAG TPA: sigma-54 dependent transcriptional regulator [Planctomycetota bacterium]|nr:sigma-54 dependent transcriptional regulator [Planctomycetota bacterium]